jgi:predicted TIM-barrel fold metal-dependent hydrolase
MNAITQIEVNPENVWRTKCERPTDWARTARPNTDQQKYFICSVDSHISPPRDLLEKRIAPEYKDRLPRQVKTDKGVELHIEGMRPYRVMETILSGEDQYRAKAGNIGDDADADMALRISDMDKDGIDIEIAFPNSPVVMAYYTTDMAFAMAQMRIYNDWAMELNAKYGHRSYILPCITTGDVELAVKEIERMAAAGAKSITMPTQPIPGIENSKLRYNDKRFEPLWEALSGANMPMSFHVATGGDPRKARGAGGAVMNRCISHEAMVEPITAFCASGILDRWPKLKFGCFEGGAGWIPALLDTMDETVMKHHFWAFPKLKNGLPSDYFRAHAVASFQEDRSALLLCEPYGLENNWTWSNDYPHHEGTWPHSAAAIERGFARLKEETRAKILGLNAARFFGFEIPAHLA